MAEQSSPPPNREPLTPAEMEAFLARVRAEGRSLTAEEQYALFGPPREAAKPTRPTDEVPEEVEEMAAAPLDATKVAALTQNFFPEIADPATMPAPRLVQGIIFDFDATLAYLARPLEELMQEGAQAAEAYMRSTGMDLLPPDFWKQIIEARRFAQEKSDEEREEHLADDAMSFLLQFYGYPASRLDQTVLRRAVDIFYAPEMSAWRLHPGALAMLQTLQEQQYKLAILFNYNCDRAFQRAIDYLGLRPYLDLCLTSATVEYRKPDPQIFQLVLERWDALPYEVVVVGADLRRDIQGGIDVGALTVQTTFATAAQVTFDNQQLASTVTADAVIDDLAQLPTLVQAWA
ncbi:MAG: HAD family hydrolase [Caldilineaceae bacterium]|nr:HAD family hydrolase [Caldilineaceae bacterium]